MKTREECVCCARTHTLFCFRPSHNLDYVDQFNCWHPSGFFFFLFSILLDSVDLQIRPRGCGVLLSARERRGCHPAPVPDQRGLLPPVRLVVAGGFSLPPHTVSPLCPDFSLPRNQSVNTPKMVHCDLFCLPCFLLKERIVEKNKTTKNFPL